MALEATEHPDNLVLVKSGHHPHDGNKRVLGILKTFWTFDNAPDVLNAS